MEITNHGNGRVVKFKSPAEMVTEAVKYRNAGKFTYTNHVSNSSFTGRYFSSWNDLEKKFYEPWAEGLRTVKTMREGLANCDLPSPVSIKRKQTWNEDDGEIDVNRYLNQEDNYFRRAFRKKTRGVQIVSLICRIGDNADTSSTAIFWRGAAVIAAVDILEEAGYSCEINAFWRGCGVYPTHPTEFFSCVRVKEAGTELNTDLLTNVCSAWFFRTVAFTTFHYPGKPVDWLGSSTDDYTPYAQFMEVDAGCVPVVMPSVYSKEESLEAIKSIIAQVTGANDAG